MPLTRTSPEDSVELCRNRMKDILQYNTKVGICTKITTHPKHQNNTDSFYYYLSHRIAGNFSCFWHFECLFSRNT